MKNYNYEKLLQLESRILLLHNFVDRIILAKYLLEGILYLKNQIVFESNSGKIAKAVMML